MCTEFCFALVETLEIIFFPCVQTSCEVWGDFAQFSLCGTTTPLSGTTDAQHYRPTMRRCRPTMQHCRLGFFACLVLIFYSHLCWLVASNLVYSIDTGLSITVLCSFCRPVGLRRDWDQVTMFSRWEHLEGGWIGDPTKYDLKHTNLV
jgi:hypothetical protein